MSQPEQSQDKLPELRRAAFLRCISDSLDSVRGEMFDYLIALAEQDCPPVPQEQEAAHKWPAGSYISEMCPICFAMRHYCDCGKKLAEERTSLKGLWPKGAPE